MSVQISEDIDPVACRALWCAVLWENWRLACSAQPKTARRTSPDQWRALRWIGSRDFHAVCALAGIDGAGLLDFWRSGRWQEPEAMERMSNVVKAKDQRRDLMSLMGGAG